MNQQGNHHQMLFTNDLAIGLGVPIRKAEELKKFFHVRKGNCYYYSIEEIRCYYEAISDLCKFANVPFSVCYDLGENCEKFRNMWANPKDCCNGVGVVKGFKKVFSDCC